MALILRCEAADEDEVGVVEAVEGVEVEEAVLDDEAGDRTLAVSVETPVLDIGTLQTWTSTVGSADLSVSS